MDLSDLLRTSARNFPDKTALVMGECSNTFAGWDERANRLANGLLALGLQAGDRVAVYMPNRLEWAETYFGVSKSGGVLAPVNAWFRETELTFLLNHVEARVLITDSSLVEIVERVRNDLPSVRHVLVIGEPVPGWCSGYEELMHASAAHDPAVPLSGDDVQAIALTSGTTGPPKGAVITHINQLLPGFFLQVYEWELRHDDVFLAAAPFCFRTGWHRLNLCAGLGATTHYLPKFDARQMLETAETHGVTAMGVVPTMLQKMLQVPDVEQFNLTHLRVMFSTSAPLPQPIKEHLLTLFPHINLHEYYAITEGGVVTNLRPADQLRKLSCAGKPAFGMNVRILDDDGREVAAGEVGEIVVSSGPGGGPMLMREYFRNPEATAQSLRDGWYYTGDLGCFDEEGYLYVVGRKKDMIISGGVNIFPRDIEEHLCTHQKVLEAAVVGLPDVKWGELVTAVIVLRPDAQADEEEFITFCKDSLASYKKPQRVIFRNELPKNSNGKVLKAELRSMYAVG